MEAWPSTSTCIWSIDLSRASAVTGSSSEREVDIQRRYIALLFLVIVSSACSLFSSGNQYAWNYLGQIDSGGVVIQIARVLLAEKTAFNDDFLKEPYFQDKPVVGEVIFIIKNNTSQVISVFPDQGFITIGNEQIDTYEAINSGRIGDYVGGEILPGNTKIGGYWFGLRRTGLDEIQNMNIVIAAPFDNAYNTIGGEYHFQIDLSERNNEAMPDELK